jgi:hypothetical protein
MRAVFLWFTQQQMDMFGHNYITVNPKSITTAHSFQGMLKYETSLGTFQVLQPIMAAESYKV